MKTCKILVNRLLSMFLVLVASSLMFFTSSAIAATSVVTQIESSIALQEQSQDRNTVQPSTQSQVKPTINLEEYKIGTGFSGVYNTETKDWQIKPSINQKVEEKNRIILKNEKDVTNESVKRNGGHLEVENELIIDKFVSKKDDLKKFKDKNVGFFFFLEDGKKLKFNWKSDMINKRNFEKSCVSEQDREAIKEVVRSRYDSYEIIDDGCSEETNNQKTNNSSQIENKCSQQKVGPVEVQLKVVVSVK